VKAIKNAAVINESPQDKEIRLLKEEIDRLKKGGAVDSGPGGNSGGGGGKAEVNEEIQRKMKEQEEAMAQMEKERIEYEKQLEVQKKATAAAELEKARVENTPQIRNMNSDPQMDGAFKFPFKNGSNKAGKANNDFKPDLSLGGVGIASPHCIFTYNDQVRKATIAPNDEDPERYPTRVNGDLLKESVELKHGDRILIGSHAYYLYVDP
jgi:hypothetical protein